MSDLPGNPPDPAVPLPPAVPDPSTTDTSDQVSVLYPPDTSPGPFIIRERPFPPWSLREVAVVFGMAIVIIVACSVLALVIAHRLPAYRNASWMVAASNPMVIIGAQVAAYPILLGFMMMVVAGRTREPFFRAIRWNWPRKWVYALLMFGILLAFVVETLSRFMPIPKSLPIDKFFNSPASAYMMAAFGLTLAPLLEEIFFRGLLYPWLRRVMGATGGVIITGGAFAAIHGAQLGYAWAPLLSIFVVGVVLTLVRERADSVAASFLTHCGYNFALFAMLWISSDHFRHLDKLSS